MELNRKKRRFFSSLLKGTAVNDYDMLMHEQHNTKSRMNFLRDENTQLKAKLQLLNVEMNKKDKEIEIMGSRITQMQSAGSLQYQVSGSVFESFLVS